MKIPRFLVITTVAIACLAGLYVTYEVTSASETDSMPERLGSLGELIDPQESVSMRDMEASELDNFLASVEGHPAFFEAVTFFMEEKNFPGWDLESQQGQIAVVDDQTVSIWSSETNPVNGTYGVFIFARDEDGNHQIWRMVTNIGQKSIEGGDPPVCDLPVYVWSNGMPVYFVSVWHWIGGRWFPYNYWWHDSHNHPNWYYSYYNHWWWRHYWYGYEWAPWYNWYYAWFYWRYFNYWSTYFPY